MRSLFVKTTKMLSTLLGLLYLRRAVTIAMMRLLPAPAGTVIIEILLPGNLLSAPFVVVKLLAAEMAVAI